MYCFILFAPSKHLLSNYTASERPRDGTGTADGDWSVKREGKLAAFILISSRSDRETRAALKNRVPESRPRLL